MKLPELPNIGPTAVKAAPQAMASAEALGPATPGRDAPKQVSVVDRVTLGPSPNPTPHEIKLAKREVEADYRILKAIIHRQINSGDYPPLETVDKLAKMMTAGTGR